MKLSMGHDLPNSSPRRMPAISFGRSRPVLILVSVSFLFSASENVDAQSSAADSTRRTTYFGGPNTPENFVGDINDRERESEELYLWDGLDNAMQPWFQTKERWLKDYNLKIGGHYHFVSQIADDVLEDSDWSAGGLLRVTGNWTPGGRADPNAGSLAFTVDYRHQIGGGVAPTELANQIGFIGQTSVILDDSKWDLVHLYWAQPFRNGTSGFVVGRIDPNDYFYTHGFGNPWTGFQNNELQQNTSIALPATSWGGSPGTTSMTTYMA